MNQINYIFTTVSEGQLHIAADTQYIGSVNSYNNCFSQFFAWIFGYSMPVNFDGQIYSVNKESYSNLLHSLNDKISDIRDHTIFRSVAEIAKLPTSNLKMRDVIASHDRKALFQKLIFAISRGETTEALSMIGQGADLDIAYYDRDKLNPTFSKDTQDLSSTSRYSFTVFHAAPILQAARKGNAIVCKFLKEAGANLSVIGEKYTFKREIIDVHNRLEVVAVPVLVPYYYHVKDSRGHCKLKTSYRTEYKTELRDRTYVTTQDFRSSEKSYRLNQDRLSLITM